MIERPYIIISRAIEQKTGEAVPSSGECLCPAHEDEQPSLSVTEAKDGKVLLKCHAGCSFSDIMASIGLDEKEAFPKSQSNGEISATYDYVDEGGELLFQVVRKRNPKAFLQRRPDGAGGWIWKTKGVRRVLYRLPQVLKARGKVVFVVEGEKDVHALERLGFVATTSPGGAEKRWRAEYSESLSGCHVVIIPDNDDPGRKHADKVARSLHGKALSVRILKLPDLPEKGDVSDWLTAGGTKEDLQRLAREADEFEPAPISVTSNVRSEQPTFQNTDLGNAERMVHEFGADLLYCHKWNSWLAFDGIRWKADSTGKVNRCAYELVRTMQKEAVKIKDDDARTSAIKHAIRSQSASRLNSMVSLAESMVPVLPEALDADRYLLNVENGTVDLRAGELRPHRQEDLITKLAPVTFDPKATCERWDQALLEVFAGDRQLVEYVQRIFGYAMTGDVSEQVVVIFYGSGANGKGTIVNTIMHVLGEYAQSTRPELLLAKRSTNGPSPGEAALKGARFVSTSETGSGQKFDEATVKRLTGGDRIRARFNRQDEFEFEPTHKIFLSTNHKPTIEGTDYAIWRRIHLVPFTVTFGEDRRDKNLEKKLKAESAGILNWMIEGCLKWQREGLNPPAAVQDATATYKGEMDVLAAFLEDCCETGIREMQVSSGRLYEAYKAWCDRTGERPERQRGFGLRMTERGFGRERKRDGYYYVGIGLKDHRQGSQNGETDVPF